MVGLGEAEAAGRKGEGGDALHLISGGSARGAEQLLSTY